MHDLFTHVHGNKIGFSVFAGIQSEIQLVESGGGLMPPGVGCP
jgi:hypothetical protein